MKKLFIVLTIIVTAATASAQNFYADCTDAEVWQIRLNGIETAVFDMPIKFDVSTVSPGDNEIECRCGVRWTGENVDVIEWSGWSTLPFGRPLPQDMPTNGRIGP